MASPGSNLTTTRINRLLRPLRNKCNSLAELPSSSAAGAPKATYSSSAKGWSINDRPPLAMLQPARPGGLRPLTEDCMRTMELARRIFAVRDCFKNIIQVSFNAGGKSSIRRDRQSIPSLAEFCSMVIGSTIQDEFDTFSAKGRDDSDFMGEDEVLDIANEIYEAVPTHYRRWTTVSHALQMILNICPHHPTLLALLIEACCYVNLVRESHTLLHTLLSMAISSSPTSPSPLSHPAHSSYLIDLCATWVGTSEASAVGARSFRTRLTFTSILVDVLENSGISDAWTCRAVTTFARANRKTEYSSFLYITTALARSISQDGQTSLTHGEGKSGHNQHFIAAYRRLNKWVIQIIDDQWDQTKSADLDTEALTNLLACAHQSNLHHALPQLEDPELSNNIITLASCCLAKASSAQPRRDGEALACVSILTEVTPIPSTFHVLISLILGDEASSSNEWHNLVITSLHDHASVLRAHKFLKLEASLWACVVRMLEGDSYVPPSPHCDVEMLRELATEAVDEAESRCFGTARSLPATPAASHLGKKRPAKSPHGEWEWEDMVGSWIRRSPVVKRPKLQASQSAVDTQRTLRSANTTWKHARHSFPARKHPTSASSISSASRTSTSSVSEAVTEPSVDEEKRTTGIKLPQISKAPCIRNFASILADAQTNVTVLHRRTSWSGPQPQKNIEPVTPYRPRRTHSPREEVFIPPAHEDTFGSMPSDDSMDLFTCNQSSPLTCK
ncbi:hypothetical protein FIBSPDRAFT_5414 [Athelia psychrophila]|uniref:Uncharacterized protein n=1 Tax=Athelia psychrophila TaxID=1759441 RepID=A0A166X109_9AGAM|nr:hypothetical protein FIBSPDRAFT_5414 [Fibularhizoctonia sp. CBS 109695]